MINVFTHRYINLFTLNNYYPINLNKAWFWNNVKLITIVYVFIVQKIIILNFLNVHPSIILF